MKNIDDILKQALTPKKEPDFGLNQNILSQIKEATPMKKRTNKKFAVVAASCALTLGIGSISIYAAWKYLKPNQAIEELGEPALADAFSEEHAVYVNETQQYGGYQVTLLGITSGQDLTEYKHFISDSTIKSIHGSNESQITEANEEGFKLLNDRSYVLFAIEKESQPFQDVSEFFYDIFPIVIGYDYETNSGLFENGSGGHSFLKDGVIYYLYECNNLEKYADHAIYMCVSDDNPSFSEYSYLYDNDFQNLARNEEYEGLNALFSLPMDAAKADPTAAKADLKALEERRQARENTPVEPLREDLQKAYDFVAQITLENLEENASLITEEGATQTFGPADKQGRISIESSYYRDEFSVKLNVKETFSNGKTEFIQPSGATNYNPDSILIEHFKLNKDGTITLQFYAPNLPK